MPYRGSDLFSRRIPWAFVLVLHPSLPPDFLLGQGEKALEEVEFPSALSQLAVIASYW